MSNSTLRKMLIVAIIIISASIVVDIHRKEYLDAAFNTVMLVLESYILFNFLKIRE
jgi:hypothetical protein